MENNLIVNFESYLIEAGKSRHTVAAYSIKAKYFLGWHGIDLSSIRSVDIIDYRQHLEKEGYKAKTIALYLEGLRAYLKYRHIQGDIIPIVEVKANGKPYVPTIPRMKIKPKPIYHKELTQTELNKMLKATLEEEDTQARLLMVLLATTGLRISEALSLTRNDILKKEIEIKGKGDVYRYIYPVPEVRRLARIHIKKSKDSMWVFPGYKGGHLKRGTAQAIIKKYGHLANVKKDKCFPHNFRHLFTINEIKDGTPLNQLADKLGIKSFEVLKIYQRRCRDNRSRINKKMKIKGES